MWTIKCKRRRIILESLSRVVKIHSNFYYVDYENHTWECMLRSKLKKTGQEPKVGDLVTIEELNEANFTGVITSIGERRTEMSKPNIANVDQAIIVCAAYDPDFNPLILDKFIILAESKGITPIICINKCDKIDSELKNFIQETYKKTGYQIIYTSAHQGIGLDDLKRTFENKVSVLTGVSGAGKSSLLNKIDSSLHLETGEVSASLGTGKHTTRHVSLQKIIYENQVCLIADTPGFSFMEFNTMNPKELAWYFKDFEEYLSSCQLSGCLHWKEPDCNLKNHIDTEGSRYLSYINILSEVFSFDRINKDRSSKKENQLKSTKRSDGKNINVVRLSEQSRENSRRVVKQNLREIGKIRSMDDLEDLT